MHSRPGSVGAVAYGAAHRRVISAAAHSGTHDPRHGGGEGEHRTVADDRGVQVVDRLAVEKYRANPFLDIVFVYAERGAEELPYALSRSIPKTLHFIRKDPA